MKLRDAKTMEYFTVKDESSGPVEDGIEEVILVLNYEASLDTIIH